MKVIAKKNITYNLFIYLFNLKEKLKKMKILSFNEFKRFFVKETKFSCFFPLIFRFWELPKKNYRDKLNTDL